MYHNTHTPLFFYQQSLILCTGPTYNYYITYLMYYIWLAWMSANMHVSTTTFLTGQNLILHKGQVLTTHDESVEIVWVG